MRWILVSSHNDTNQDFQDIKGIRGYQIWQATNSRKPLSLNRSKEGRVYGSRMLDVEVYHLIRIRLEVIVG
jgi:hypothetical protein